MQVFFSLFLRNQNCVKKTNKLRRRRQMIKLTTKSIEYYFFFRFNTWKYNNQVKKRRFCLTQKCFSLLSSLIVTFVFVFNNLSDKMRKRNETWNSKLKTQIGMREKSLQVEEWYYLFVFICHKWVNIVAAVYYSFLAIIIIITAIRFPVAW